MGGNNSCQNGRVRQVRGSFQPHSSALLNALSIIARASSFKPCNCGEDSQPGGNNGGLCQSPPKLDSNFSFIRTIARFSQNPFGLFRLGGMICCSGPRWTPRRFNILVTIEVPLRCMPSTQTISEESIPI